MNSICLSVAPNLRCESLSRTQNIIILVPPAIELIFSLTLALANASDRGRKHWLLVLDGLSFFLLALADFLAHFLTQARSTLIVFKIIDFVVAGASFLPLLSYTLFLWLFSRSNLVTLLPTRFSRVVTITLFIIIPPVIAFHELGSLLGIKHVVTSQANGQTGLAVGFSDPRLPLFFSSAALALLTLFQAALFSLCFLRVVRAFLDERRVEAAREDPDAPEVIHLFRGLGWLVAGLKLGAVESVVGFATLSFGAVLTRRVLRLFGRGALIIGIIKGMNIVEDFVRFETDVQARRGGTRRSKRFSRFMISNPRNSTFREMSPHATTFHAAQREKKAARAGPSPLALGGRTNLGAFERSPGTGGSFVGKERVTVMYDGKTPPVLQMRFSGLDLEPVPPLPANVPLPTIEEERRTTWGTTQPRDTWNTQTHDTWNTSYGAAPPTVPVPAKAPQESASSRYDMPPAAVSNNSLPRTIPTISGSARTASVASDSLEAVREIASRFPNLPPRVIPGKSKSPLAQDADPEPDPDADWRSVARSRSLQRRGESGAMSPPTVSPGNSIKRKPAPMPTAAMPEPLPEFVARGYAPEPEYASAIASSPSSLHSSDEAYSVRTAHTQTETPGLTRVSTVETSPVTPGFRSVDAPPTPAFHSFDAPLPEDRLPGRLANRVMAIESKMAHARQADADTAFETRRQRRLTQLRRELRAPSRGAGDEEAPAEEQDDPYEEEQGGEQQVEIPWLHSDPLTALQTMGGGYPVAPTDIGEDDDVSEAVLDEAWRRAGLTRIKSVSQVRVRTTPRVEHSSGEAVRGSLFAVEEESLAGMPEGYESERSESGSLGRRSESLVRPARLDSGVLGEEDRRLVRQGVYN